MTYTVSKVCTEIDETGVYQDIQEIHSINVGADAWNPADHDDFILPQTTPMSPVWTGTAHSHGVWMPIRRSLVNAQNGASTFLLLDSNPFHVGDVIHRISVSGPAVAVQALGAITAINRTTHQITVAMGIAAMLPNDWVEVTENGCVNTSILPVTHYLRAFAGMMRYPYDTRMTASSTAGEEGTATIVVEGKILERDVNWNDDPTDDKILIAQMLYLNRWRGIEIIPWNKSEITNVPGLSGA